MNSERNIILIGYRCTGKTAVGKALSARLKMPFYDTDDLIKKETGRTVADLVAERGWPFFREREREAIEGLAGLRGAVIAPGGGAVADEANAGRLGQNGIFIWLRSDLKTILARMKGDRESAMQRPSLLGGLGRDASLEISEVLRQRRPVYKKLASFSVDTSKIGVEAVADRICAFLKSREKGS